MKRAGIRRELAELARTAEAVATDPQSVPAADEAVPLAGEMAASFGTLVRAYLENLGLSHNEAVAQAGATDAAQDDWALRCPPDQVQWHQLNGLAQRDPDIALIRWEEVKQAARAELQSGFRAGRAMECEAGCWDRARYAAIRCEIADGVRPRNGLEWQLVDMMAQAQTQIFGWQETLTAMSRLIGSRCQRALNEGGPYETPRLSDDKMIERSMSMIERWHAIYMRTLKAYRDQRRNSPAVVVRRAGQVNVGAQQVNIAGT
jgi:hypothetical protein